MRQDAVYPEGPMRPPQGIQRGSVEDMMLYPGDPLTPGVGATKDAKRLRLARAPSILKIPALPISYADAQVLLAAMAARWRRQAGAARCPSPIASARAARRCIWR